MNKLSIPLVGKKIHRDQLLSETWNRELGITIDIFEERDGSLYMEYREDLDVVSEIIDVIVNHVPDSLWNVEPKSTMIPEDIPIKDKKTGNIYYLRVEEGFIKVFDVEDNLVKSRWRFW